MKLSLSNNPIDKLSCWIYNKKEKLSQVKWIMGGHKKVECRICGGKLDNWKDMYSPMQCGWYKVNKYSWICHKCLDHRNFRSYINQIDEDEHKLWNKDKIDEG